MVDRAGTVIRHTLRRSGWGVMLRTQPVPAFVTHKAKAKSRRGAVVFWTPSMKDTFLFSFSLSLSFTLTMAWFECAKRGCYQTPPHQFWRLPVLSVKEGKKERRDCCKDLWVLTIWFVVRQFGELGRNLKREEEGEAKGGFHFSSYGSPDSEPRPRGKLPSIFEHLPYFKGKTASELLWR